MVLFLKVPNLRSNLTLLNNCLVVTLQTEVRLAAITVVVAGSAILRRTHIASDLFISVHSRQLMLVEAIHLPFVLLLFLTQFLLLWLRETLEEWMRLLLSRFGLNYASRLLLLRR